MLSNQLVGKRLGHIPQVAVAQLEVVHQIRSPGVGLHTALAMQGEAPSNISTLQRLKQLSFAARMEPLIQDRHTFGRCMWIELSAPPLIDVGAKPLHCLEQTIAVIACRLASKTVSAFIPGRAHKLVNFQEVQMQRRGIRLPDATYLTSQDGLCRQGLRSGIHTGSMDEQRGQLVPNFARVHLHEVHATGRAGRLCAVHVGQLNRFHLNHLMVNRVSQLHVLMHTMRTSNILATQHTAIAEILTRCSIFQDLGPVPFLQ